MSREIKIGAAVAGSFLSLVGIVVGTKMYNGDVPKALEPLVAVAGDIKKEIESPKTPAASTPPATLPATFLSEQPLPPSAGFPTPTPPPSAGFPAPPPVDFHPQDIIDPKTLIGGVAKDSKDTLRDLEEQRRLQQEQIARDIEKKKKDLAAAGNDFVGGANRAGDQFNADVQKKANNALDNLPGIPDPSSIRLPGAPGAIVVADNTIVGGKKNPPPADMPPAAPNFNGGNPTPPPQPVQPIVGSPTPPPLAPMPTRISPPDNPGLPPVPPVSIGNDTPRPPTVPPVPGVDFTPGPGPVPPPIPGDPLVQPGVTPPQPPFGAPTTPQPPPVTPRPGIETPPIGIVTPQPQPPQPPAQPPFGPPPTPGTGFQPSVPPVPGPPNDIRPVPIDVGQPSPPQPPNGFQPLVPPMPVVKTSEPTKYLCQGNENYALISLRSYGDEKFARALEQFNRELPGAPDNLRVQPARLQAGTTVLVPPANYLHDRYGTYISAASTLPPVTPQPPTRPLGSDIGISPPAPLTNPATTTDAGVTSYRIPMAGMYLSQVAERQLGNPLRWIDIYRLNPGLQPEQPLREGMEIRVPAK